MDVAASLRPCEIDVTLAGEVFTVPALSAADWLVAILDEEGGSILPGLLAEEDQKRVYHMVLRGELEPAEVNTAWRDLMSAATGRSWWSAARLCRSAADPDAWAQVHGRLFDMGVDLDKASIGALCNAIFFLLMTGAKDDEERSTVRFELELPPPGSEEEVWEDRSQIAEDFMSNFAQLKQLG